jgi:hypothetical protein
MFSRGRKTILGATAAVIAAAALPAGAHAAQPCAANLPGPSNQAWVVKQDGTLRQSIHIGGGSVFDAGHGRLAVNGAVYPEIPNEAKACTATATQLNFPTKSLGGVNVSRSISASNGLLRYLDSITNPTAQQKVLTVDWGIRVLASQNSVASETGNGPEVTSNDHWAVLKSSNAFPFLRWGEDSGLEPEVQSDDPDSPAVWKQKTGLMPDADLHYTQVVVGAGQTVRLLHTSGATGAQADSVAAANATASPFAGYSKTVAGQIVNWGPDPDKDGVSKASDACPSVKGDLANGCQQLIVDPPADPSDPNPVPDPGNPAPAPDPGTSDPAPVPGDPGNPAQPGKDTKAPKVAISKLGKSAKLKLVTGKGLKPRISCDETCKLTVRVMVRRKGSKKDVAILTVKSAKLSKATRTIAVKVKAKALKKLAKQRVTLVVVAVDAAGNKRTVSKQVSLTR